MGTGLEQRHRQGLADDNPYDDAGAGKMNLWAYDSYHASSYGYYLEAAMDFGKVTGKDPMMLARDNGNGPCRRGSGHFAQAAAGAAQAGA